ncbi:MAG: hypothetical protein QOE54_4024, partial [Streptosporangiaceae bacterium]|nr:hypothetical protein [Streptosporangiaceae bacterium]
MAQQSDILVIGATGNVGRHVVSGLLEAGARVRALTRDPDAAALPAGADAVRGDLSGPDGPDGLEAGLDGVGSVFLVWPFGTAEGAPPVLEAVGKYARRIVYLSSMGVREDLERQADPITQFHADIERLIERSGLEWTFLRPGGFATNTLGWAQQIRAGDVVRWPFGAMARPLIHERDIAAAAVHALIDDGHGGAKHVLTGPEALTQVEQVHAIGVALGRPLRFEETPREAARQQLIAAWGDASFADGALTGWARMMDEPEPVTHT